jgi:hypothetical protein
MSSDGFPYPVNRPGNFGAETSADKNLIARLRQCSEGERTYVRDLMREAANELERLRADLAPAKQ